MTSQAKSDSRPTVTAVVTSYKRFDLLETTLKSFVEHNTYPLDELIVIEDSDDAGVHQVESVLRGVPHRIILNGRNKGQIASVDAAYENIASDYIFHMEDDWRFTAPGFIERAIEVLEKEPQVILVSVRDEGDMPGYIRSLKTFATASARYKRMFPKLHFQWHSFTFNPSLKRTADYRAIPGGYGSIGDEGALSLHYKAENRDTAWLMGDGARHIGHERSNYGTAWVRSKSLKGKRVGRFFRVENLEKWRESLRRKFWHGLRRLGLDTEPLQRGRRF